MDAETLWWLYSTIAQTLGAILAVGGMVCVFRLETLRHARWSIIERMSELCLNLFGDYRPPARRIIEEFKALQKKSERSYDFKGKTIILFDDSLSIKNGAATRSLSFVNIELELANLTEVIQLEDKIGPAFIKLLKLNLVIIGLSILILIFCRVLAATPLWIGAIGLTLWAIPYSFYVTFQLCNVVMPRGKQGKNVN